MCVCAGDVGDDIMTSDIFYGNYTVYFDVFYYGFSEVKYVGSFLDEPIEQNGVHFLRLSEIGRDIIVGVIGIVG